MEDYYIRSVTRRRVDTATEELFRKFQVNERVERGRGNTVYNTCVYMDAFYTLIESPLHLLLSLTLFLSFYINFQLSSKVKPITV